jgi:hypothetical protein
LRAPFVVNDKAPIVRPVVHELGVRGREQNLLLARAIDLFLVKIARMTSSIGTMTEYLGKLGRETMKQEKILKSFFM